MSERDETAAGSTASSAGTPSEARVTGEGWPDAATPGAPSEVGWPEEPVAKGTPAAEAPAPLEDPWQGAGEDESELEAWLEAQDLAEPVSEPPASAGIADASAVPGSVAEDEPQALDAAAEDEPVPGGRPGRGTALLAALVAVLVGLTAFLAVTTVRTRGVGSDEQARRDALGAARNAARLVFSYDYRRLDQDFAAGLATTTGDFREEYSRTTAALKKDGVPTRYKAVVVADVIEAAVVTGDDRRVEVLLFLDQQSTSTTTTAPKITRSRVVMRLVPADGDWRVEKISAL